MERACPCVSRKMEPGRTRLLPIRIGESRKTQSAERAGPSISAGFAVPSRPRLESGGNGWCIWAGANAFCQSRENAHRGHASDVSAATSCRARPRTLAHHTPPHHRDRSGLRVLVKPALCTDLPPLLRPVRKRLPTGAVATCSTKCAQYALASAQFVTCLKRDFYRWVHMSKAFTSQTQPPIPNEL